MNSRFYWLIVFLILGSIAMGACTAAPAPTATLPPQPTLTPEPTFTPEGFPVGDYKPDKVRDARFMHFMADGTFISSVCGCGQGLLYREWRPDHDQYGFWDLL